MGCVRRVAYLAAAISDALLYYLPGGPFYSLTPLEGTAWRAATDQGPSPPPAPKETLSRFQTVLWLKVGFLVLFLDVMNTQKRKTTILNQILMHTRSTYRCRDPFFSCPCIVSGERQRSRFVEEAFSVCAACFNYYTTETNPKQPASKPIGVWHLF